MVVLQPERPGWPADDTAASGGEEDFGPVDFERLVRLRSCLSQPTAQALLDAGARAQWSAPEDPLLVFQSHDAWLQPYLPPLDRHLVGVVLEAQSPQAPGTTWLQGVGLHQRPLQRGEVLVVPAGAPAFVQLPAGHQLMWLALRPRQLYAAAPQSAAADAPVWLHASPGTPDPVIHGLALALHGAAQHGGPPRPALAAHLAQALALQLLAQHGERVATGRGGSLGRARLERALAFMDSRMAQPVDLAEAANVAGCSVHHFAHLFKAAMGVSPMRYLRERRMQAARELIETTGLSMAEIGVRVGLHDAARFSQAFRAYWKTSPSALRRAG